MLTHGVVPSRVQDFAVLLVELHEVSVSPIIQPVKVPLGDSSTVWHISYSSQFCIINKLARVHSASSSRSLMKMLNRTAPSIDPWAIPGNTGPQPDFVPLTSPLGLAIQPVFIPPHSLLI